MKKLFVCALAVGMFTACSQDETISQQSPMQISFNGAFVENATRADVATDPSTTTNSITAFDVWGFMDTPDGVIFENEDVTGTQGNFSYANTQYWVANHNYYFAALAPMNSKNVKVTVTKEKEAPKYGLGTVYFDITDGSEDLLYAATTRELGDEIDDSPVKFQFNHLLSKVKFTFKNGFTNDNMKVEVKGVQMEAPYGPGQINLNQEDWWTENHWILERPTSQKKYLAFGDAGEIEAGKEQECANERLIFPTSAENTINKESSYPNYNVKFTAVLYNGEVEAGTYEHEITLNGIDFKIGRAYDLVAELNATNIDPSGESLKPIVFDVQEVKVWGDYIDAGVGQNVDTEEELFAAISNGGHICLTNDIALTKSLNVTKNTTLNLNGKKLTISNESEEAGEGDGIIVTAGHLVINGEGTVEANTRAVWARGDGGAKITINAGTYVGSNIPACEVIYASGNGVITINGGTFEATYQDEVSFAAPQYAVLNLHSNGADGCNIVVYGGSFKNFDPSNNVSENPKKDFVADGYKSVANGEYFDVVKE